MTPTTVTPRLAPGATPHPFPSRPRVLITRPVDQTEDLRTLLTAAGCQPVLVPTVRLAPLSDFRPLDAALHRIASYRWVVFASANAARFVAHRIAALGISHAPWAGVGVIAGPATAAALTACGLPPTHVLSPFSACAALQALAAEPVAGARVLLPRAEGGREALAAGLRARGALVDDVAVYRTVPITHSPNLHREVALGVAAILFFSPSAVRGFAAALHAAGDAPPPALARVAVACLGPTTAAAARAHGLRVDVVPPDTTATSLATALLAYLRQPPPPPTFGATP